MPDVPEQQKEGVESALERVRRRLYTSSRAPDQVAPSSYQTKNEPEHWQPEPPKKGLSLTAWFFVVAFGFFLVAGITATLIVVLGGRSVGNERISIRFETSVSVSGGEEVAFDMIIENENPVEASDLSLTIDFPEQAFDPSTLMPRGHYVVPLETLLPGASVRHSVPVLFFGSENERVQIPARLEYRTPNSSAVFVKEDVRELTIATAPLSLRITAPSDISSGQQVALTASIRSNADEELADVAVKIEYPFGFTPLSTSIEPVGHNVFVIGTLRPGEEAEISITGSLIGEDGDDRVFRFEGGVLSSSGGVSLRTPSFTNSVKSILISRSFIATALALNQQKEDIVVSPGETISGLLTWANSLASTITDAQIEIALTGDVFDYSSVSVANGFYRSQNKTLVFEESTEAGLRSLSPGETGAGAFTLQMRTTEEIEELRNPTGTLTISVSGRRSEEGGREENLRGVLTRTVSVGTSLTLENSLVHTIGPFENSGPFPPEAEKETTYSVIWTVENSINTVANASVSATLPPYVRYTGFQEPETITYDDVTRTVTWALGEVAPGVRREGAFQIAVTPSTTQRGTAPLVLENVRLRGFDRFVQKDMVGLYDPLTTYTSGDPDFGSDTGRVR